MHYMYLIRPIKYPAKTYIGYTNNLEQRLEKHNNGASSATTDFKPWKLVTYIAFDDGIFITMDCFFLHSS